MIALLLATLLPSSVSAAVVAPSQWPAMRALENVEQVQPEQEQDPKKAKDKGSLGFTIRTLEPVGFSGEGQEVPPKEPPKMPGDEETLPPAQRRPAPPPKDPAGAPAEEQPRPKADVPATSQGSCYKFNGNSALKGVTIYTPEADPTCKAPTEEPERKGPVSKTMVYGALGAGAAAVAAGFLWWPPLLLLGGLLLGAGAVLWYINKKLSS